MIEQIRSPLIGGMLIGLAASLLLLLRGKIFGISGILASVLLPKPDGIAWRVAVILGLITAGIFVQLFLPSLLASTTTGSPMRYVVAGLLVGFGTQLGSGCTSGHGICGVSRMSPRSITATTIFIIVGMIVVAMIRAVGGAL